MLESRRSIAFVGDGITQGGDWQSWFPDRETHNLGLSGSTSDDLIGRREELGALQPEAIALMIGTNDFGNGKSVEHVVRNVEFLLMSLRRELPGTRMLVQSILPRAVEFTPQIEQTNRHLRQFAPVVRGQYLDLWPVMALAGGEIDPTLSDDGLHPNAQGYGAWLAELRPALERLDEAPPMSRPIPIVVA